MVCTVRPHIRPLARSADDDDNWDEIVIDDFEIKKVWIIEDADEMISDTAEEFKSNITSTKLPVEITNAQSMEAHVRDVAMKATGRS